MQTRARNACFLLATLLTVAATPAMAEVMDKEPTTGDIWRSALPLALLAFGVGRLHPLLGLGLAFVPSAARTALFEIHNSVVGPAIRAEAGIEYVFHTYAANGLTLGAYLLGVALWKRRRLKERQPAR